MVKYFYIAGVNTKTSAGQNTIVRRNSSNSIKMKAFDIVVESIYDHFFDMQKKGRKIVPWFQTCFIIALMFVIDLSLGSLLFYRISSCQRDLPISENLFLTIFIIIGIAIFILIKNRYFSNDRQQEWYNKFLGISISKRKTIKVITLTGATLIPFLILFLLWVIDK